MVEVLATACGAVVVRLTPEEHDLAVARISHLPHLMAAMTAGRLRDIPAQHLALSGQGVRDVTRIAAGDPALWRQIVSANADSLGALLRDVRRDVDGLIAALDTGDVDALDDVLRAGASGAAVILGKHGGPPVDLVAVTVTIPDRPGALAEPAPRGGLDRHQHRGRPDRPRPGPGLRARGDRRRRARRRGPRTVVAGARMGGAPVTFSAMASADPSLAHVVIAMDGTAGAGKSTASRGVARRLGLRYLDTGAMYRALTWEVLRSGTPLGDADAVAERAERVTVSSGTDPDSPSITLDGVDVSREIRTDEVTATVSQVSAVPRVRRLLVDVQRREIGAGGIVVEGRDIGTVVAPDADLKVFLTADPSARARRRAAELSDKHNRDLGFVQADLARRDSADASRPVSGCWRSPPTPSRSTRRTCRWTLSSTRSSSWHGGGWWSAMVAEATGRRDVPDLGDVATLPGRWMWFGKLVVGMAMRRYDVHVRGADHIPAEGPVILASNHMGYLDGPLLFLTSQRGVHAMVKESMFSGPMGFGLARMGQIEVDRFRTDPRAVKNALQLLRRGRVVAIYPEGARGRGDVASTKGGAAYLALVTGAPVVPVACLGTRIDRASAESRPPPGSRLDLVIGSPMRFDAVPWPRTNSRWPPCRRRSNKR